MCNSFLDTQTALYSSSSRQISRFLQFSGRQRSPVWVKERERVGGNGAWHVHFIYLCCRIEWQPLAGLETYLTDRVSSACVRPHFYCCFAYFYLSARERETGEKCGLLIHVVSEKCYLLILLFKCKNAKRKLACQMPGVYQILRRPHTHTHTHKHSNTHPHTYARHSSAVAYT